MVPFLIVVIGVSAGGMAALEYLLPALPGDFPVPIVIVQHLAPANDDFFATWLDERSALNVREAEQGMILQPGHAYLAPANYHLLFEDQAHLALSNDEKVNFSRPSIDMLFESAAMVFGAHALAIVLTGANADGSRGAAQIQDAGGRILIQEPNDAEIDTMPKAAIAATTKASVIMPLAQMPQILCQWCQYE